MTTDEIALAKISEKFLTQTAAQSMASERLAKTLQAAVDTNPAAIAAANTKGQEIQDVAENLGLEPNGPILEHLDEKTQGYVAPRLISLADAFACAVIAAQIKPVDLARIVPQDERTAANSAAFMAHGNACLAQLFSPSWANN